MESPIVLDKPPEYHGNERGFPFDEEEGSGPWSQLAARHPDIAARLRQHPATWARKRRPSSQDGIDDSADSFGGGFDRFPFDDIPSEFREYFPSHWNRRFGPREEQYQQQPPSPQPHSPQQQTIATQTEYDAGPSHDEQTLPQYGLRNTVDLGQKSPADPSVVDAEDRSQRSMSAPPDHRTVNQNCNKMSGQNHQEQPQHQPQPGQPSNVRHIPIHVEGRDKPVINTDIDHGTHFADAKPTYVPPPQTHIDPEQYFADYVPAGFRKTSDRYFRQPRQQRSQSPKPQTYHEQTIPRPETPSRPQQKQPPTQQNQSPPQQKQPPPQQKQPPTQQRQPPPQAPSPQPPHHNRSASPQPKAPPVNDPVQQIFNIQADVLNLTTEIENFKGTKKDKQYIYLDEMLTRNLIKLDNIETEGKENIRQRRKEVIACIQKFISVLEAKAENKALIMPQQQDVEMHNTENEKSTDEQQSVQNGDVEMKDQVKDVEKVESQLNQEQLQENLTTSEQTETANKNEQKQEEEKVHTESKDTEQPIIADTRPEETKEPDLTPENKLEQQTENVEKKTPKKTVKKRDKSKDKKNDANEVKKEEIAEKKEEVKDENKEEKKTITVNKNEDKDNVVNKEVDDKKENVNNDNKDEKVEVMQIDAKGDLNKPDSQAMEIDSAASQ